MRRYEFTVTFFDLNDHLVGKARGGSEIHDDTTEREAGSAWVKDFLAANPDYRSRAAWWKIDSRQTA